MKSVHIRVHPTHPQQRLVRQAAELVTGGGVLVCPTDASYSLVCVVGNKQAEDRIRAIRHVERSHYFTLLCRDLGVAAQYGKVANNAFRLIKQLTPGPYTFILSATRETPRRLQDPKRRMVGLRIPDQVFIQDLLAAVGEPLLASTLMNDEYELPYAEPEDMLGAVGHAIDGLVDVGAIGIDLTTVLDMSGPQPELVREGKGAVEQIEHLG